MENFSFPRLQKLASRGLLCHVANAFDGESAAKQRPADLHTYPWLIIEYKPLQTDATAAAAATGHTKKAKAKAGDERHGGYEQEPESREMRQQSSKAAWQAANSAAAVLIMFQNLVRYSLLRERIPPVVTMTTVGAMVRVWLTFHADDGGKRVHVSLSSPFSFPSPSRN